VKSERPDIIKEEILEERMGVLDAQVHLWESNCKRCTQLIEGMKSGVIPKGTGKDKPNKVCNACPAQPKFLAIGKKLTRLTVRERSLRKE
jgi:hypothetical protein